MITRTFRFVRSMCLFTVIIAACTFMPAAAVDPGVLTLAPPSLAPDWNVQVDASGTHFFADLGSASPTVAEKGRSGILEMRTEHLDVDPLVAQAVAFLEGSDGPVARLGVEPRGTFTARSVLVDASGGAYVRCDQAVDGARVFGGQVVVRIGDDGRVTGVNGVILPVGDLDPREALTATAARAIAVADFGHTPVHPLAPADPEKMILWREDGARLAWRVSIHVASEEDGTANWEYFVDALDGRILLRYDDLKSDTPVSGDGVGVLGDLKSPLELLQVTQGYAMADVTRRDGGSNGGRMAADAAIETYDGLSLEDPNQIIQQARVIVSSTPHLRGSQGSVLRNAVDGHFHVARTYDYYLGTFGWNSWDNKGSSIYVVVNYGRFVNNAFWNGTFIAFGQGDGNIFVPLAGALDVTAHELTHAVTDATSALIYRDQSGALNESMSDVFGALVDRDDWTIGESIAGPGLGRAFLRSMADPTLGDQPAHMDDYRAYGQDRDNGGVHSNSGIPNKAAYLFAEGGTFHGVQTIGQGRERLERVWFHALTAIMTSGSSFADAREATVQAARQIYPGIPGVETAARNAWAAVGVGSAAEQGGRGAISGRVTRPGGAMADVRILITNAANTQVLGNSVPDPATGDYQIEAANGDYRVFAIGDANHNSDHEAGEPYGYYDRNGNHTADSGDAVTVHDDETTGANITIDEATGTSGMPAPSGLIAQGGARGGVPLSWSAPAGAGTGEGAPGGGASAVLSGTISRSDGGAPAGTTVGLFPSGSSQIQSIAQVPESGSTYSFENVPAGSYGIAALFDVDGDGRIATGDLYGIYDANGDGEEDEITVTTGVRLTGLDIALAPYGGQASSSVSGTISRQDAGGVAGSYAIFVPSNAEGDAAGSGFDAPAAANGWYALPIDPGTYAAYAILDLDDNGMFNRGDWFGWRDDPVMVNPGQNATGIDMQMMEIPVDFFSEVESNDGPDVADAVSLYSATFAEIAPVGDEDWFAFDAPAMTSVIFDVDAPSDPVQIDSYMELYNFTLGDAPFAFSDDEDYPTNVDPYIAGLLPTEGTYYVRIFAYSEQQYATGPYTLYVLAENGMGRGVTAQVARSLRRVDAAAVKGIRAAARRARLLAPGGGTAVGGGSGLVDAGRPHGALDGTGAALLGYNIYRSTAANVSTIPANRIANVPASTRTALDAQAQPGQTYHYVVTAVYDQGESAKSNEAAAAPSSGGTLVACGDLNNSGSIDLSDVAVMLQTLVDGNQAGYSLDVIDVNANGRIDVADAARVTRAYGTGEPLDCGTGKQAGVVGPGDLRNGSGAPLAASLSVSRIEDGTRIILDGAADLRALAFEFRAQAGATPSAAWADGRGIDCFPTAAPGIWRLVAAAAPALSVDPRGMRVSGAGAITLLKARGVDAAGQLRRIVIEEEDGAPVEQRMLAAPRPNPAVDRAILSFRTDRGGPVEVRICDVAGRTVRRLLDGPWEAGDHELIWDGRDDGGSPVSAGLYFAELRAGPEREHRKIILLRASGQEGGAR
jgi:bacillolysin